MPVSPGKRGRGIPHPPFHIAERIKDSHADLSPDGARIPAKNIAITAAAKLASLKQAAAEFPRWQHFSRRAPTGIGYLGTLGIVEGWRRTCDAQGLPRLHDKRWPQ